MLRLYVILFDWAYTFAAITLILKSTNQRSTNLKSKISVSVAVVVFVSMRCHDMSMPAVMNGVAAGFLCLSGRHVAVAPAHLFAVICTRRRGRVMMPQHDAPVIAVVIVTANATVTIMVAVPIAVMMPHIIAVTVLVSMVFGKRRSAESQRQAQKHDKTQSVHNLSFVS